MPGWGDLPTELTLLILRNLVSQQDIVRALAVCRQFRALLEPKLYEKVSITKPRYEYDSLDEDETETPQLLSLVCTIAARPELGLLVRSLTFGSLGDGQVADGMPEVEVCNTDYDDQQREEILSSWGEERAGDMHVLLATASQKGLPNGLVLNRNHGRGKIVFLLHCLPNLLNLTFECTDGLATIAYAALGRFRGGVPVGLQSLKHLVLNYDDTEMGFGTRDVVPFLALPALSGIRVWAFAGEEWEDFLPEDEDEGSLVDDGADGDESNGRVIHARSSGITHLHFGYSSADCDVLNRILTLPRRLKSFKYEAGGATVAFTDYAPARFIPGLCTHASSLVELFLTGVENTSTDWDENDVVINSALTVFTALRHLRVNTDLLLGRPRPRSRAETEVTRSPLDALLPRSLVIFELELGYKFSFEYFIAITGVPKTLMRTSIQLPALRKYHIGIQDTYPHSPELGEEIAKLNRQPDVVSPRGHQIQMKAGSPYFYISDE